ncbi:hypothetical protein ACFYNZ_15295 [Streptomyces kebangsaanensis]|uniref:Uncharacterized protein n=1 Tax=Streptomyces kebangsaanensis TaxID=864058 RepID=A0ABW6KW77_9ACTN
MGQCPQCGSSAQPDPEHAGVLRCLTCWHGWTLPRVPHCPGYRPTWNSALRALDAYRNLRR